MICRLARLLCPTMKQEYGRLVGMPARFQIWDLPAFVWVETSGKSCFGSRRAERRGGRSLQQRGEQARSGMPRPDGLDLTQTVSGRAQIRTVANKNRNRFSLLLLANSVHGSLTHWHP